MTRNSSSIAGAGCLVVAIVIGLNLLLLGAAVFVVASVIKAVFNL